MSFHTKDWLNLAAVLGLGATGFGLAGMGPMAGLLGVGTAADAGAAAGGAAMEGMGMMPAGLTQGATAELGVGSQPMNLGGLLKGLNTGKQAMGLLNQPPQQAMPAQRPQTQQAPQTANPMASIYPQVGGQANPMDPNYQKYLHQMGYF